MSQNAELWSDHAYCLPQWCRNQGSGMAELRPGLVAQMVTELATTQREQAVVSRHQQKELWDWIKHGTQRIVILAALIRSCLPLPPPPPAFPGSG